MALVGEGADELFGGYPTYHGRGYRGTICTASRLGRAKLFAVSVESLSPGRKKNHVFSTCSNVLFRGRKLDGMARHQLWMSNITPEILARLGVPPSLDA